MNPATRWKAHVVKPVAVHAYVSLGKSIDDIDALVNDDVFDKDAESMAMMHLPADPDIPSHFAQQDPAIWRNRGKLQQIEYTGVICNHDWSNIVENWDVLR